MTDAKKFQEAYETIKALLSELEPQMTMLIRQTASTTVGAEPRIVRRAMLEPIFAFNAALARELAAAEQALGFGKDEVS